jgi:hypothetical protein
VRFRFALAVMVAGLLFAAGIASAQTTTTDTTTSGYTDTTSSTTEVTPTTTTKTSTAKPTPTTEGQSQSSAAPAVAAQQAPSSLAFTGGEPLLIIIAGLAIAGGTATMLVRDRRRSEHN